MGHTFGGNFKQRRKPRSQAPPFLFDAYSGRPSSDCAPPLLRRRSWPRCSDFLRLLLKLAFNFLDAGFAVPWRCPISDGQKNTGFFATQIPTAVPGLCSASRALLGRALFGEPGFVRYGDRNSGWQKIWYYFQDLWSSAFLCVSPASALRAVQATKNACLNPPNLYFFDSQISFLETVQKKNFAAAGNSPLGRPCGAQNLRRKVSTVSFSRDLSVPQF